MDQDEEVMDSVLIGNWDFFNFQSSAQPVVVALAKIFDCF